MMPALPKEQYTIGWICALPKEMTAARYMLDEYHGGLEEQDPNDSNAYCLGSISGHNVVIGCLPKGVYGTTSAAKVATNMLHTFKNVRFGLLVGIGGGVPSQTHDIRLGDVVVSTPTSGFGGVIQHDAGKQLAKDGFTVTGWLNKPPDALLTAVSRLETRHLGEGNRIIRLIEDMINKYPRLKDSGYAYDESRIDQLFEADGEHEKGDATCKFCGDIRQVDRPVRELKDPVVHYGIMASGNQLMKDRSARDRLGEKFNVLCFETEAAGLMDHLPALVIRGICDYADSHKNDSWQEYAAAAAAAYAKELLSVVPRDKVAGTEAATATADSGKRFCVPLDLTNTPAINEFVGRDDDLRQLWELLQPDVPRMQKVAVLQGLGGVGKTQLAIRFARMHKDDFTAIFWLNGKSREALMQSMAVALLKIPGKENAGDPKNEEAMERMAKETCNWLDLEGNSRWLLIFDNVDQYSPDGGEAKEGYDVKEFFPSADHGSIIITSRVMQLRELGKLYPVQKLGLEEAVQLLVNSSGGAEHNDKSDPHMSQDIRKLAARLDGLPLALVIAGSFVQSTGMSFTEYLNHYEQSWYDLQAGAEPQRQYSNGNLLVTWTMSYTEIKERDPSAANLLLLLSFFDNRDIWFQLIHHGLRCSNPPKWFSDIGSSELNFLKSMRTLITFSLVETKRESNGYWMHPVVQDWCQYGLGEIDEDKRERLKAIALTAIGNAASSISQRQSWILEQRLLPHADQIIKTMRTEWHIARDPPVLDALYGIGSLYRHQERLKEAELLYKHALAVSEEANGLENSTTVRIVTALAILYVHLGKEKEAETAFQRCLVFYEKSLGPDGGNALQVINNLGVLYRDQGRLEEAEAMLKRALDGFERTRGPDSNSTFSAAHDLGKLYVEQSRFSEAETMYRRALSGRERVLGPDHIYTLQSMDSLARLLQIQGRSNDAEVMYKKSLSGKEKALSPDHKSTLYTVHGLGRLYLDQKKLEEAEAMLKRALDGYERTRGPDSNSTLSAAYDLGKLYVVQKRFCEAETMYRRALSGRERMLGPGHTGTLQSMDTLARLLQIQGRFTDAEDMYKKSLSGKEKTLGPGHAITLHTVQRLGKFYVKQERLEEAEAMLRRASTGFERTLGPNHRDTAVSIANLGYFYYLAGKLNDAEIMYKRALIGHKEHFGQEHQYTQLLNERLQLVTDRLHKLNFTTDAGVKRSL